MTKKEQLDFLKAITMTIWNSQFKAKRIAYDEKKADANFQDTRNTIDAFKQAALSSPDSLHCCCVTGRASLSIAPRHQDHRLVLIYA